MNERIIDLLDYIQKKRHHRYRQDIKLEFATVFSEKKLSNIERATKRLTMVLNREKAVILPNERIVYLRTIRAVPELFTPDEWELIKQTHYIHELGRIFNICPDYETTIRLGLKARRQEAVELLKASESDQVPKKREFLQSVIRIIDAIEKMAALYKAEAEKTGNWEVARILSHVPRYGARTFHEALQFFRILHFTLSCAGHYHNTIGRFDQYMYPFLKEDMETGRINRDEAIELLEEAFISFNKDSDLYPGMQQGDNGQSMVLGGVDADGRDAFNLLSKMCLEASLKLKLIDPKINLRVHENTSPEVFELGTQLTKQGLGFPQYSNDEIVIPGLVDRGYDLKDARNYVVAACWEFIIPEYGMDIPNIGALSFPKVVDQCLYKNLLGARDFDAFMSSVREEIVNEVDETIGNFNNIFMEPSPFMSMLMDGCLYKAKDISSGSKYNNYGIHGTGIATAVDSLAVIKKFVFETNEVTPRQLIEAVDKDFDGYTDLLSKLKYSNLKMGNDEDYVDDIAVCLLEMFSDVLALKKNDRGGCYRAGTGSAMYYIWHTKEIGASPDGRKKGEPFSANFSPSLNARVKGPFSIIKSFTKPDLKRVVNGGPLTLELHSSVFRNEESVKKVGMLVKSFCDMGGHQIQLNAVNRDVLIKAQKDPGHYRNLIVRVWGWSGYFVELDKEYQDHIIKRTEFVL